VSLFRYLVVLFVLDYDSAHWMGTDVMLAWLCAGCGSGFRGSQPCTLDYQLPGTGSWGPLPPSPSSPKVAVIE